MNNILHTLLRVFSGLTMIIFTTIVSVASNSHTVISYDMAAMFKLASLLFFATVLALDLLTSTTNKYLIILKNITGVIVCIFTGYCAYLDEGIVFGIACLCLMFSIMSVGEILIHIDHLPYIHSLKNYTHDMQIACALISGFVALISVYYVFYSGLFFGSIFQKAFLVFLISTPSDFFYTAFLSRSSHIHSKFDKALGSFSYFINAKSLIFILSLLCFRTLCYDIMIVPSGSMMPNFRIGDFVLVQKCYYGISQEMMWPIGRLCPWLPIYNRRNVETNDIVCWTQDNFGTLASLVKRVVATEGQTFSMDNNHIVLNGHKCEWTYINQDIIKTDFRSDLMVGYYTEHLPNGKTRLIQTDNRQYMYSDTMKYYVYADHFAVVGDNRTMGGSHDCRDQAKFPMIHKSRIIGRPRYVVFASTSWMKWTPNSTWSEFITSLPIRAVSYFKYLDSARCLSKVQ